MITEFFDEIKNIIAKDKFIKDHQLEIYIQNNLDVVLPCIFIETNEVRNFSNKFQNIYQIDFFLNLLTRDDFPTKEVADRIIQILKVENFSLNNFEITGISNHNIKPFNSKDQIIKKLEISYFALIKKEII